VRDEARRFRIESPLALTDLELGASVAVAGVCLTVISAAPSSHAEGETIFTVDAAFETLRATKLGDLRASDLVNLEPSLRVGDALGGHFVSGHVDGVANVRSVEARGDARHVVIEVPRSLLPFIAVKGSVTVDGVSLTVNEVDASGFGVGLIPHTLEVTTLGTLRAGDRVNLEVDVVARYVARLQQVGGIQ